MKLNEKITNIKESATLAITAKAKAMKKSGEDVLIFGAGEPDFPTPKNVKDAAIKAINDNFSYYTPADGIPELKKAIVDKFKRENKISYTIDEVLVCNGGKHALYNLFQVILQPGDEVIVPSPYWVSYDEQIKVVDGKSVFVDLGDELKIKSNLIKKKINDKTKAIVLNTPSNPTGMICDRKEVEKIAQIALDNDILVISDEVYEHFIYDGKEHCSIASLNEEIRRKTLTVNAVSKTYSMTGWRIGYLAGDKEIIKAAAALQSHCTSNPTSIAQKAAVEALNGQQDSVKEMKDAFNQRRKFIVDELNSMQNVKCVEPEGAFYVFPDISATGMDSMEFSSKLLEQAKVAVIPGIAFGSDKHVRISYATSMGEIKKGMGRIKAWLEKL